MFDFELPDLGEGVAEGEVLEWHVTPGDRVREDDVLAEVETDKAAVDVPSPVDGVVQELHYHPGDTVRVGAVLVSIEESEDDGADEADAAGATDAAVERAASEAAREETDVDAPSASGAEETSSEGEEGAGGPEAAPEAADASAGGPEAAPEAADASAGGPEAGASERAGRVFAPPTVRRLARELDVPLESVDGSGPAGRITEEDVREAARAAEAAEDEADAASDEGAGADVAADDEARERELKSAVRRVGEGEKSDEAAGGESEEAAADEGPTSVVQRVDESGADVAGADAGGPAAGSEDEPAVKSAVQPVEGESEGERRERTLATPKTRRVARELDVDLNAVPTEETRDGEPYVSEAAVRAYAEQRREVEQIREATGRETAAEADAGETATGDSAGSERPVRREPYRGVRRRIGEQMQRSRSEVPHATHHDLAVVPGLVEARERLQPLAEERDVRLTYMPLVLKAVAAALQEHPVLNTELDAEAEEILFKEYYHLGVATATDAGLMVPVVEDVGEKGILEVAGEVTDLVARARDRSLSREELQGSTFTVTNFGAIGGEYADPIINVPETAILGTGELRERPVVEDGEVVARPTLPLSLAIDHRVIDGADAARFVETLKEYLAAPWLAVVDE